MIAGGLGFLVMETEMNGRSSARAPVCESDHVN